MWRVDLVDQAKFQQLRADRRRKYLDVLTLGGLERDLRRLLDGAAEHGHAVPRTCVLGMMGQHEDRSFPSAAVGPGVTDRAVEAVPAGEYGAGRVDVLPVQSVDVVRACADDGSVRLGVEPHETAVAHHGRFES
jgi:hypothetical protein